MNLFIILSLFCIGTSFIRCDTNQSYPVTEYVYNLADEMEIVYNLEFKKVLHRTISVFDREYHFYADGSVLKGEKFIFGEPIQSIEHEPTKVTELEFDDFLNKIEKPSNIELLKASGQYDEEFGSINFALAFLKPNFADYLASLKD